MSKSAIATLSADPTFDECMEFLSATWGWAGIDEFEDSARIAIYILASRWHSGQWSNLYSALCQSGFNPGRCDIDNDDFLQSDFPIEYDMFRSMEMELEKKTTNNKGDK